MGPASPLKRQAEDIQNQMDSKYSVDLQSSTRSNILSSNLDDETRNRLISQIDAIGAVSTQDRMARLKPILDTLSQKKAMSDQVTKLYQNAVAQASKLQSTVITSGLPAAIAPVGNGSIITGGVKS